MNTDRIYYHDEISIEIYLAYQYHLREDLSLSIYMELHFDDVAKLTKENGDIAKTQIMGKEKQEFIRYLVNDSDVWKKKMSEWSKEQIEAADKAYQEKINEMTFEATRSEFYNVYGKNKTDALHYEIFFPLTDAFLRENNAISLLEGFHH